MFARLTLHIRITDGIYTSRDVENNQENADHVNSILQI